MSDRRTKRPGPKGGSATGSWRRRILCGTFLTGIGAAAASVLIGWLYVRYVVEEPGPHLDRDYIMGVISEDSPVYYRDGVRRVGVFFEDEHRHYVPYADLPEAYVMSLVAAEDGAFFTHWGLDLRGIARAARDNVVAGHVVAGGSTLTQQTAKNLYYRPDRSWRSKGIELVNALRLEAHYDKTAILEFYSNQFHVTGNGRGVGIAARHFFDKDVADLTLAECAFVAGLVKAPSYYDPFLGDEASGKAASERAHERTRYVLAQLVAESPDHLVPPEATDRAERIERARTTQEEAQKLLDSGFTLQFRRGAFRYDSSAVLDEVARRIGEPPFDEVLAAAEIEDPATAGLEVITTLDADIQREATYALWHHLTEAGAWLEAPSAEDFIRKDARGPRFDPDRSLEPHSFRLARVAEIISEPRKHLTLDLGGRTCVADRDAMVRGAAAVARGAAGNRYAKASTADVDRFADAFDVDDVVFASIRSVSKDGALCDLEWRPELQGAVVVLEDGEIRAMVGGNDNRDFNRATALRQMGSTWKPLVYHAALQLGWGPEDPLDNDRGVFPFSTTFYYPRPDHEPQPVVSMAWAGVNSENLASIWLLYHLTDRLDTEEVGRLAETLGLARRPGEDESDYRVRIQKAGVLPTPTRVEESLYLRARHRLIASGTHHPDDALALSSLHYGWGFAAERGKAARLDARTRARNERALDNSWVAMERWMEPCALQYQALADAWAEESVPESAAVADLSVLVDGYRVRVACGAIPQGYVRPADALFAGTDPLVAGSLPAGLPVEPPLEDEPPQDDPLPLEPESEEPKRKNVWRWFGERLEKVAGPREVEETAPQLDPVEQMLVQDRIHLGTLRALDEALRLERVGRELRGEEAPGLYDPEILYWHQDFRVLLSLKYVVALAHEFGVRTDVQQVLALPLGASEITLEEAAALYQGLTTGERYGFPGETFGTNMEEPPAPALLISQFRDVDGRVLYEAKPRVVEVTRPESGDLTTDILRNVVQFGTGQRASGAVLHGDHAVPLAGKTGTTNDYRNAAFVGVAPAWTSRGYDVRSGFVVAVYVGYDDNRPLERGRTRLQGASGALPAWIGTVQAIDSLGLLGDPGDAPIEARELVIRPGLEHVPVNELGLPAPEGTGVEGVDRTILIVAPEGPDESDVELETTERPPRIAPRTDEPPPQEGQPSIWN